jgi:FK506-binding protein 4/5
MHRIISYHATVNGQVIDSAKHIPCTIGSGKLIPPLESQLSKMTLGTTCTLEIRSKDMYGKKTSMDGKIPSNSTILYTITYESDFIPKGIHILTFQEKLNFASLKKEEGNELFKEKKYDKAKRRYQKAIQCLNRNECLPEEIQKANDVLIPCWSNLAMTFLNLKNYEMVIQQCTNLLTMDPNHIKGRFRRVQGYIGIEEFEMAQTDLSYLNQLDLDKNTRELLIMENNKLKQLKEIYHKKSRKMFEKVFE